MKYIYMLSICAMTLLSGNSALAWCPFGENDYCVKCSDRTFKEVNCPGGEVGMVLKGIQYPNCQISYYGPQCNTTAFIEPTLKLSTPSEPPRVTAGMLDGKVILQMTKEDFLKIADVFQKLERDK